MTRQYERMLNNDIDSFCAMQPWTKRTKLQLCSAPTVTRMGAATFVAFREFCFLRIPWVA